MMVEDSSRELAFLDTNTLHFMDCYLHYSSAEGLSPTSDEDLIELERRLARVVDQALRRSIRNGMKTINWLLSEDVKIEYSPISELELISGRARGAAVLNAAREGIPDRMWTRIGDADVRRRVAAEELGAIGSRLGRLSDQLDALGISTLRADAHADARADDVWELARGLAELVYLSPNDGIIYAGALQVQADYLITSDEYFRRTANEIRDSDRPHFREVRRQVRDMTGSVSFEREVRVMLPSALTPARLGDSSST